MKMPPVAMDPTAAVVPEKIPSSLNFLYLLMVLGVGLPAVSAPAVYVDAGMPTYLSMMTLNLSLLSKLSGSSNCEFCKSCAMVGSTPFVCVS